MRPTSSTRKETMYSLIRVDRLEAREDADAVRVVVRTTRMTDSPSAPTFVLDAEDQSSVSADELERHPKGGRRRADQRQPT
jgi:hypothetical protein